MNKFVKLISAAVLGLSVLAASAQQGGQVTGVPHFFTTGSSMVISNNQTLLHGATNVFFTLPYAPGGVAAQYAIGRWSQATSNFIATTGQSGTNYPSGTFYFTNAAAFSSTNALAGGYLNNTNVLNGNAWDDINGWANRNGDVGSGTIWATVIGVGSLAANVAGAPTNNVTLTFAKMPDGTNFVNNAADLFIWTFQASAATNTTFVTNLGSAFMTGARRIKLWKISTDNVSSGTNVVLGSIGAFGWQ